MIHDKDFFRDTFLNHIIHTFSLLIEVLKRFEMIEEACRLEDIKEGFLEKVEK